MKQLEFLIKKLGITELLAAFGLLFNSPVI